MVKKLLESVLKFVTLGNINISKNNDHHLNDRNGAGTDKPQNIEVNEVIIHPGYKSRRKLNDIAILRLEKEVSFSESIRPICIPSRGRFELSSIPSRFCIVGGGQTRTNKVSDVLKYAEVSSLPIEKCKKIIPRFNVAVKLDETYVCTAGANQGNHCNGYSGGPLQYKSKLSHRFVQHGVVSFGVAACEKPELPGVYTRVDQFASWIHQVVYGG
nr:serine protease grass-like [Aedes albopictus]